MSALAEIEAIRVRKHAYQVQAERDLTFVLDRLAECEAALRAFDLREESAYWSQSSSDTGAKQ